jgi:hypothetical protein
MGVRTDSVSVHIEELVLTGFPPALRHAIGDAVQTELARLIGESGIGGSLASGGNCEQLQGGSFALPSRSGAGTSGSAIARHLYAALSREGGTNGAQ